MRRLFVLAALAAVAAGAGQILSQPLPQFYYSKPPPQTQLYPYQQGVPAYQLQYLPQSPYSTSPLGYSRLSRQAPSQPQPFDTQFCQFYREKIIQGDCDNIGPPPQGPQPDLKKPNPGQQKPDPKKPNSGQQKPDPDPTQVPKIDTRVGAGKQKPNAKVDPTNPTQEPSTTPKPTPTPKPKDPEPLKEDPEKPPYPVTPVALTITYKIGVILNLGKNSSSDDKTKFKSLLKIGYVSLAQDGVNTTGRVKGSIKFDDSNEKDSFPLETGINDAGVGFELSTLNYFHGKLYACDSETGIVYQLVQDDESKNYTARPFVLLPNAEEGFNCKWGTVKDDQLWFGSTGELIHKKTPGEGNETESTTPQFESTTLEPKHEPTEPGNNSSSGTTTSIPPVGETTTETQESKTCKPEPDPTEPPSTPNRQRRQTEEDGDGEFDLSRRNVKKITQDGHVIHMDWSSNYRVVADALGVNDKKGGVTHEAVAWSEVHQKWLLAPRRVSKEKQAEDAAEAGTETNSMIWSDSNFAESMIVNFGELHEHDGVTDVKFIPGTNDEFLLVLKSGSKDGTTYSYLEVYDSTGEQHVKDAFVGEGAFEGVEFL